jgi:tetratricopeptide (TPR) repeat protein
LTIQHVSTERVTFVRLEGKLDKQTRPEAIAEVVARPTVMFNLGGIQAVTDDGVAHWRAALAQLDPPPEHILLTDCSPAVVDQINAGKGFVGDAAVVSVGARLHCDGCGRETLVAVDMDQPVSEETLAFDCAECGSPLSLEQPFEEYFAFAEAVMVSSLSEEMQGALIAFENRGAAASIEPNSKEAEELRAAAKAIAAAEAAEAARIEAEEAAVARQAEEDRRLGLLSSLKAQLKRRSTQELGTDRKGNETEEQPTPLPPQDPGEDSSFPDTTVVTEPEEPEESEESEHWEPEEPEGSEHWESEESEEPEGSEHWESEEPEELEASGLPEASQVPAPAPRDDGRITRSAGTARPDKRADPAIRSSAPSTSRVRTQPAIRTSEPIPEPLPQDPTPPGIPTSSPAGRLLDPLVARVATAIAVGCVILVALVFLFARPSGVPADDIVAFLEHLEKDQLSEAEGLIEKYQGELPDTLDQRIRGVVRERRQAHADSLIAEARTAFEAKLFNAALETAERALEIAPGHLETVYLAGESLRLLGRLSEARVYYQEFSEEAGQDDDRTDDALFWQAAAFQEAGQMEQARLLCQRVLEMKTSNFRTAARRCVEQAEE